MTAKVSVRLSGRSHKEIVKRFSWSIPRAFNIGIACSDVHPPGRVALRYLGTNLSAHDVTFGELSRWTDKMANALLGSGLSRGDRVAVCLPQRPETAVAHLGAYKAGLIALPLSPLFGPDALGYRLRSGGARILITDEAGLGRAEEALGNLSGVRVVCVGETARRASTGRAHVTSFDDFLSEARAAPCGVVTAPADPCLLMYTSGTSGPPKGVLHAHHVLIGQAPGFRLAHEFTPRTGDRFWTPADWAWVGGLVNSLLLAWYNGLTVVAASRRRFDPEWAIRLMAEHKIRNAFIPTTALRMILRCPIPSGLCLRTLVCGGEAQEPGLLPLVRERLGVTFNESYGQTEADFIVGNCGSRWPVKVGSAGRPYPGHHVAIMGETGDLLPPGAVGEIVVRGPDPAFFLSYWRHETATADKYRGEWLRTGDLASMDDEGYIFFRSRADDVIKSSGYRIGPSEIEECLLRHPAVRSVAVVGAPDSLRGQIVKAYIVTEPAPQPGGDLVQSLQDFVRSHLGAYQYPRSISFVEALPLTATGKVNRGELRRRAAEDAARVREKDSPSRLGLGSP